LKTGQSPALFVLLFDDLQHFHRASLNTDATGDALGNRVTFLMDHDLHGANLDALAATDTQLLVDHVYTGLGILGDSAVLTQLHALAALDAGIDLGATIFVCNDLDAAQIRIKFLIECLRAGLHTLQTSHALRIFLNSKLLHKIAPYCLLIFNIIQPKTGKSNIKL
jgi:hypothetical protein